MAAVREAWTDERLDDLNGRVDEEFRALVRLLLVYWAAMIVGFAGTIATILIQT